MYNALMLASSQRISYPASTSQPYPIIRFLQSSAFITSPYLYENMHVVYVLAKPNSYSQVNNDSILHVREHIALTTQFL